jgi:hypothetical protein
MAVNGAVSRAEARESRWVTPLANKFLKICLRPRAAGSAELLSFHHQLHRPNSIEATAIGGGAMFVATHVLEHCQKY